MRTTICRIALAVTIATLCGCTSTTGPNWLNPGTVAQQRQTADRFDPYPENDTGPAIVGGRPRDYQIPRPEPERARWNPFTWAQRSQPVP